MTAAFAVSTLQWSIFWIGLVLWGALVIPTGYVVGKLNLGFAGRTVYLCGAALGLLMPMLVLSGANARLVQYVVAQWAVAIVPMVIGALMAWRAMDRE